MISVMASKRHYKKKTIVALTWGNKGEEANQFSTGQLAHNERCRTDETLTQKYPRIIWKCSVIWPFLICMKTIHFVTKNNSFHETVFAFPIITLFFDLLSVGGRGWVFQGGE